MGADARMRQTSAPYLIFILENTSYQFVTHIAAVAGAVSRNIDIGRGTIDYTIDISRADNLTGIARCINNGVGHAAIGDMCRVVKHSDDTAHLGTLGRAVGPAADCGIIHVTVGYLCLRGYMIFDVTGNNAGISGCCDFHSLEFDVLDICSIIEPAKETGYNVFLSRHLIDGQILNCVALPIKNVWPIGSQLMPAKSISEPNSKVSVLSE